MPVVGQLLAGFAEGDAISREVRCIARVLEADLPAGVTAQLRTDGETRYVFLMNFSDGEQTIELDGTYTDVLTEESVAATVTLARYGIRILRR